MKTRSTRPRRSLTTAVPPDDPAEINQGYEGEIPSADTYTFYVVSDDGARLYLDDRLAVDNWGDHGLVEVQASMKLPAGQTSLRLEYFDHAGDAAVRVSWSTPTRAKQVIPGEYFVR